MEEQIRSAFIEMSEKLLGWLKSIITSLPNILVAVVVFLITMFLARVIKRTIRKWMSRTRASMSVSTLVSNIGAIVIVLAGLYMCLGVLDLDNVATGILTTASISGLIVGLALQNAFANTFAGVILSLLDDIQIGDWIESNNLAGEVQRITLRSTTIKGPDNNLVYIPNKEVLETPIKNFSRTKQTRIILTCGVEYRSDLLQVRDVTLRAIMGEFSELKEQELDFYYTEFSSSSINFTVRYPVNAGNAIEQSNARSRGIVAIKQAFDKANITIPFPIRTLYFDNPLQAEVGQSGPGIDE